MLPDIELDTNVAKNRHIGKLVDGKSPRVYECDFHSFFSLETDLCSSEFRGLPTITSIFA